MLLNRRRILKALSVASLASMGAMGESNVDPWSKEQLIEPAKLAERLKNSTDRPVVISVVFPVLYRQKHIPGAKFAGPTCKPEGILALKQAVSPLSKTAEIVLYCGCCPMVRCPNIRPAFETLTSMGYTRVTVLNLATNFRTDWEDKGYPVTS